MTPEDEAAVQGADAEAASSRQESLGAAAPEASEPLEPSSVNALGEILQVAIPKMTVTSSPIIQFERFSNLSNRLLTVCSRRSMRCSARPPPPRA